MRQDLVKHGCTDGCPRCRDLQGGRIHTQANHSEECRARIYGQWEATGDAKWKKAFQQLGIDSADNGLAPPTVDVELEGLEQIGSDSRGSRTPRHTTTAHSEAPPDLDDEDGAVVADHVDREAFPDDVPDQHVGHEDEVADLFMSEEADEDAMVTALLLAGVESDVAKMYAARLVGSAKAQTFYEVYSRGAIV